MCIVFLSFPPTLLRGTMLGFRSNFAVFLITVETAIREEISEIIVVFSAGVFHNNLLSDVLNYFGLY